MFLSSMLRICSLKIAPVFRMIIRPRPETPNLIMQLPTELRNRIYELIVLVPEHKYNFATKLKPLIEPELFRTSKQIRQEGLPIYYGNGWFELVDTLDGVGFEAFTKRLYGIVDTCGPKPFKDFKLRLKGYDTFIWRTLESVLQLLELMRATGFEPACEDYVQGRKNAQGRRKAVESSLFRVGRSGNVQFVLEKSLSLARRARVEE